MSDTPDQAREKDGEEDIPAATAQEKILLVSIMLGGAAIVVFIAKFHDRLPGFCADNCLF